MFVNSQTTFQETNQEDFFREVEGSTHHYQALPPPNLRKFEEKNGLK